MTIEQKNNGRESTLGRWAPVGFYGANFALWFVTGITANAWDLLYLALLPLPVIAIYLWRTR